MTTYAGLYPATQGVDSHGVLLLVSNRDDIEIETVEGTTVTPDWLPVAQIVDVSSPSMTKTFHDVTPAIPGSWKQVIPGYKDPGSVTLSVLFNSSLGSHRLLLESYTNDTKEKFMLVIPEAETEDNTNPSSWSWNFDGYVLGLSTSHSAGGIIIGNVSIKVTGKVTTTTGLTVADGLWPDVSDSDTTYSYEIS